jgi:hypothetical protein
MSDKSEFHVGQIMSFAETKCPTCGQGHDNGIAFCVERVWNGTEWVMLNSFEGGRIAATFNKVDA